MNQEEQEDEDLKVLKCFLNGKHFVCVDAVKFPCKSLQNNADLYACTKCVRKKLDYTQSLLCANCEIVHRFHLNAAASQDDEEYAALANKNAGIIAKQLISHSDSITDNIKSNFETHNHDKFLL